MLLGIILLFPALCFLPSRSEKEGRTLRPFVRKRGFSSSWASDHGCATLSPACRQCFLPAGKCNAAFTSLLIYSIFLCASSVLGNESREPWGFSGGSSSHKRKIGGGTDSKAVDELSQGGFNFLTHHSNDKQISRNTCISYRFHQQRRLGSKIHASIPLGTLAYNRRGALPTCPW